MAMHPAVTYTPYATSSKEQAGNIITFTQFEEENIITETRNYAESGDESDNKSIMMNEQDMEDINYGDESDHDLISTEMLEQTGDVITFTQFEEGNILTETRNDAEIGDESDNKSIIMSEQDMDAINSGDK